MNKPHRALSVHKHPTKGDDVKALKRALNKTHEAKPALKLSTGFSDRTFAAAIHRCRELGVSNTKLRGHKITPRMQELIRGLRKPSAHQRRRAKWRRDHAVPGAMRRVLAEIQRVHNQNLSYAWGGSHNEAIVHGDDYDCSSWASHLCQMANLKVSTATTYGLAGAGKAGEGKWLTLYIKNPPNPHDAHVIVRVFDGHRYRWTECGGSDNPRPKGGPCWFTPSPARIAQFPIHRHFPELG